jgi:hypothetical protein
MWYLTRGTATVSLLLLTLSVVLGVLDVRRVRTETMPRFVLDAVHRNASLLAVAFIVVHIVTSVLDGFAPISLFDGVIPFTSAYRPVWLGLGALSFDLLIAVTLTSLLRRRFGHRAWRAVHWTAYASWPLALVHGLGTGSDTKLSWMLVIVGLSVIAVIVAAVARATAGWPDHRGARLSAILASALVPIGLLVWLPSGPLAAGWAQRAGTPASVLTKAGATTSNRSSSPSFTAEVTGTVQQGRDPSGMTRVDIPLAVAGQPLSKLEIVIFGQEQGGGVRMTDSRVTLGPPSDPSLYDGRIVALNGTNVEAQLHGSGAVLRLTARLRIDRGRSAATGTVTVR